MLESCLKLLPDLTSAKNSSRPHNVTSDIETLKYYAYGVGMPIALVLGIVGNILNLVVLTRPNMKGAAYIYMRGYAFASLLAIICAIPFSVRILEHSEVGFWSNYPLAFYHTYLELYLGNACLATGVMMLVALTVERFLSVCYPAKARQINSERRAYITVALVPFFCLAIYTPYIFHSVLVTCKDVASDQLFYQKRDNKVFMATFYFKLYRWFLEACFRVGPIILLACLNIAIICTYRRVCARRRQLTRSITRDDRKVYAEEHRLMFLLGGTSLLFFVCVSPVVVVGIMYTEKYMTSFGFQIFRAIANVLEVMNYSLTFYIYCLFSKEFRETFLRTIGFRMVGGANGDITEQTKKSLSKFSRSNNVPLYEVTWNGKRSPSNRSPMPSPVSIKTMAHSLEATPNKGVKTTPLVSPNNHYLLPPPLNNNYKGVQV